MMLERGKTYCRIIGIGDIYTKQPSVDTVADGHWFEIEPINIVEIKKKVYVRDVELKPGMVIKAVGENKDEFKVLSSPVEYTEGVMCVCIQAKKYWPTAIRVTAIAGWIVVEDGV